jgi:ADP-ribosylglycohydrolase
MKHFDSFEDAMIAAVNHDGDSDSTGAITGNILGAAIGYDAIPDFYKKGLEMYDLILHMADDLYRGEVTKF